jgi:hypothetical protein
MATLKSNEIEAANRAEVTALLIRSGYRVYNPEADVSGEDLILRTPSGALIAVQQKGRLFVDNGRYGVAGEDIWMLFPECPYVPNKRRSWYLVPHNILFDWLKGRHGHAAGWNDVWGVRSLSKEQRAFLEKYEVKTSVEPEGE